MSTPAAEANHVYRYTVDNEAYTLCQPGPTVPANSENTYEQLVLANGMKVTLVSIPNAEKSAAAMSINAGANEDTLAGLAHFTGMYVSLSLFLSFSLSLTHTLTPPSLPTAPHSSLPEHAVFLGSEKFQEQNHFKKLLSKSGGRSNGACVLVSTSLRVSVISCLSLSLPHTHAYSRSHRQHHQVAHL